MLSLVTISDQYVVAFFGFVSMVTVGLVSWGLKMILALHTDLRSHMAVEESEAVKRTAEEQTWRTSIGEKVDALNTQVDMLLNHVLGSSSAAHHR